MEPLNPNKINDLLQAKGYRDPFAVHVFDSLDSTNRYLKDYPRSEQLEICCAEQQTQGRGRFNRYWHSPYGENIYCSGRWGLHVELAQLAGLSLVTSLAIVAVLKAFDVSENIQIKWPNDILWHGRKLCGSLIEILPGHCDFMHVIIGVGLNVNSDTQREHLIDKDWVSLYEISQHSYDRNPLVAALVYSLDCYLSQFIAHGLELFIEEWQRVDYLMNKPLQLTQQDQLINGIGEVLIYKTIGCRRCKWCYSLLFCRGYFIKRMRVRFGLCYKPKTG